MEEVRKFIESNCIARAPRGEKWLLRRGAKVGSDNIQDYMTWMFMLRAAMYDSRIMGLISEYFVNHYREKLKDGYALVGIEHSSTPMLTAFMLAAHNEGITVPVISIRKEQKTYGLKTWFEGFIPDTNKFILVDDISSPMRTSMKFMLDKIQAITNCSADNPELFCLINLGKGDTLGTIPIHSVFCKDDFILDHEEYVNAKISEKLNVQNNGGIQSVSLDALPA